MSIYEYTTILVALIVLAASMVTKSGYRRMVWAVAAVRNDQVVRAVSEMCQVKREVAHEKRFKNLFLTSITERQKYKVVEITVDYHETVLGDIPEYKAQSMGTTLKAERGPRIRLEDEILKNCLANYVPGLREATTIVHIPRKTLKGVDLDFEQRQAMFWWACNHYGVPMWTQSSIKANTFYFVREPMFKKLTKHQNLETGGPKWAAYGGLLFSEMDKDARPIIVDVPEVLKPLNGEDGNCKGNPLVLNSFNTVQFRGFEPHLVDYMPVSMDKGIANPDKAVQGVRLNDTQVKLGGAGKHILLTHSLITKEKPMWISAEPLLMLRDTPQVRAFLADSTYREVLDYLSLLTEAHRVDLLKRIGELHVTDDGDLEEARRAVGEALHSNMPWCEEIETRITRFAIDDLTRHVIPSGGLRGWIAALVIDNEKGANVTTWDKAKVIAFRIPVTGSNAIIPLDKDPYQVGTGHRVTAEVAKLASGDADGDYLIVIRDKRIIDLFRRYLNPDIVSGLKPDKEDSKAPITAETMQNQALAQMANAWMVGALNVGGWKMIQIGDFETASELLDLANLEPVTYKRKLMFKGEDFRTIVARKYGLHREQLKNINLQWRDAMLGARQWRSPREMCHTAIEQPLSHLDACWNAGVRAAIQWDKDNPLKKLSLGSLAAVTFGQNGIVIPGSAYREKCEIVNWWGLYWQSQREQGTVKTADHSPAYQHAAQWGEEASREAIAALLVWMPQNPEFDGFSLKWHAAFSTGRAHEVLGYHPQVKEYIARVLEARERKKAKAEGRTAERAARYEEAMGVIASIVNR